MVKELTPIFDLIIATSPDSPQALSARVEKAIWTALKVMVLKVASLYLHKGKDTYAVAFPFKMPLRRLGGFAGSLYMIRSIRSILKKIICNHFSSLI